MRDRYWVGFLMATAIYGLMQDLMGKDGYLKAVGVDTKWWMWLVLSLSIIGIDLFTQYSERQTKKLEDAHKEWNKINNHKEG